VTLAEIGKRAILAAIKQARGNVSAAKELGIGKTTVYRKIKQYSKSKGRKLRKG
jgi:two-component system response regulator HydG